MYIVTGITVSRISGFPHSGQPMASPRFANCAIVSTNRGSIRGHRIWQKDIKVFVRTFFGFDKEFYSLDLGISTIVVNNL